jgi:hypothetical protein
MRCCRQSRERTVTVDVHVHQRAQLIVEGLAQRWRTQNNSMHCGGSRVVIVTQQRAGHTCVRRALSPAPWCVGAGSCRSYGSDVASVRMQWGALVNMLIAQETATPGAHRRGHVWITVRRASVLLPLVLIVLFLVLVRLRLCVKEMARYWQVLQSRCSLTLDSMSRTPK